jgi:hypothetical protein
MHLHKRLSKRPLVFLHKQFSRLRRLTTKPNRRHKLQQRAASVHLPLSRKLHADRHRPLRAACQHQLLQARISSPVLLVEAKIPVQAQQPFVAS